MSYYYSIKTDKPASMKISDLKNEIDEIEDLLKQKKKKEIELDKKLEIEMQMRLSKLKAAHSEKTLKEQLKDLDRKEKEKEKKTRTHRLVQIGGIIEMYYPNMSEDEAYKLLEFIISQDERGGYASKKVGREVDNDKISEIREKLSGKKKEPEEDKTESYSTESTEDYSAPTSDYTFS